jgi:hypothetical protein
MHSTQAIRLSHADDQRVGNRLLSASSAVIVAVVVLAAIIFFSKNPFRVGEITVATPNGPSVTVKVANSNDISELIQKGLENEQTRGFLSNSLLDIIEKLPVGSKLSEKLVELAEKRKNPFSFDPVPVMVVYNSKVPQGLAAVCEKSDFLAKNIVVFAPGNNPGEVYNIHAHADAHIIVFPCLDDGREIVHLNSKEVLEFNSNKVMAKRVL